MLVWRWFYSINSIGSYTLRNDQYLIVRRNEGNKKAAEPIKIAEKVGGMLIHFPYVRGIAISGPTFEKNFADDTSDIDLFIITAKNRLMDCSVL